MYMLDFESRVSDLKTEVIPFKFQDSVKNLEKYYMISVILSKGSDVLVHNSIRNQYTVISETPLTEERLEKIKKAYNIIVL